MIPVPPWRDTVVVARYVPAWVFVARPRGAWPGRWTRRADRPHRRGGAVVDRGLRRGARSAGAGVREAVFIAASGLDHGLGATVAVASRVLFIIADGGGARRRPAPAAATVRSRRSAQRAS